MGATIARGVLSRRGEVLGDFPSEQRTIVRNLKREKNCNSWKKGPVGKNIRKEAEKKGRFRRGLKRGPDWISGGNDGGGKARKSAETSRVRGERKNVEPKTLFWRIHQVLRAWRDAEVGHCRFVLSKIHFL